MDWIAGFGIAGFFYAALVLAIAISPLAIWINVHHMRNEVFESNKKIVKLLERIANDLEGKPNQEPKKEEPESYAALRPSQPRTPPHKGHVQGHYSRKWMG